MSKKILMCGNDACGEGAVLAGCRLYAGYLRQGSWLSGLGAGSDCRLACLGTADCRHTDYKGGGAFPEDRGEGGVATDSRRIDTQRKKAGEFVPRPFFRLVHVQLVRN